MYTKIALHSTFPFEELVNISRLSPEDIQLFQAAFRHEPVRYCNNWLYMLRSTRNDQGKAGYKFVGKNALIGIGYRNHTIYLVHPMGSERFSATLEICHAIKRRTSWTIVLKKLDQDLYEYLLTSDLFHHTASHSENPLPSVMLEEEAFPERMLCLTTLCDTASKEYQKGTFIRKVRRFEKNNLTLSGTSNITQEEFSALVSSDAEKYKCYKQMVEAVNSYPRESYKTYVYHDEQAVVHGLYIAETLRTGVMGLYCAVSSKKASGITEWMDHDFFQQLYQEGIHTLYLGGSETQGVDAYIHKLFPTEPSYVLQPMIIR